MSSITFSSGTVVTSDWLNSIDFNLYGVEKYGAVGDGVTDDTAALQAAFNAASSFENKVALVPGKTYKFSLITIPDNVQIFARGAILKSDSSLSGSTVTITIGNNVTCDELNVYTDGTETNTNILSIGTNFTSGLLNVVSTNQRVDGGIVTTGQQFCVGTVRTRKIDRPLHFYNQSLSTATTKSYVAYLDVEDFVRAFRADFCSFNIGRIRAVGRSPNASKTPGHNGVLILGCTNFSIGDCWIDGAGEHAIRIGGSPGTYTNTSDFSIGNVVAIRPGGCAFKVNPTLLTSPGVTEKCYRGTVGYVLGIDVGDGALAGNEELLRLTHARDLNILGAYAVTRDQTVSAQYALQINDCSNVIIGELGGNALNSGFISINGTSDVDGVSFFGGDVTDLRINKLIGATAAANNAIGVNTAFNVGRVFINEMDITGYLVNLLQWSAGTITDVIEISGRVYGSVAPVIDNPPSSSNLIFNIQWNNTSAFSRGDVLRAGAGALQLSMGSMSVASVAPSGLFLNAAQGTAAASAYGGSVEFSRVGSTRRGGAAALIQTGSAQENTGIELLVGSSFTSSDALLPAARVTHERTFAVVDGVTEPATSTGWAQIYVDSADGDLKIKFGDGTVKTIVVDT